MLSWLLPPVALGVTGVTAVAAPTVGVAAASGLSGPDAFPAIVLLKRRMLICSSSLSTTGVTGYCLVRP